VSQYIGKLVLVGTLKSDRLKLLWACVQSIVTLKQYAWKSCLGLSCFCVLWHREEADRSVLSQSAFPFYLWVCHGYMK